MSDINLQISEYKVEHISETLRNFSEKTWNLSKTSKNFQELNIFDFFSIFFFLENFWLISTLLSFCQKFTLLFFSLHLQRS